MNHTVPPERATDAHEADRQSPFDILNTCIHCGMCLQSCPTYALTGLEISSPRGRIRLMKSVAEDNLPMTRTFVDEMYFCLDCQACETVCPAGVRYGALVENARQNIAEAKIDPVLLRFVKWLFLTGVLSSKRRLNLFAAIMRLYQKSGLREAVDQSGILSVLPRIVEGVHALLPRVADRVFDETVADVLAPRGGSIAKGRVAFLTGCIMNITLPDVHRDAVEVLRACGYEVVVPKKQECCGSLHGHHGDVRRARTLARRNIDVFDVHSFDFLVVDSAGCGAFLKEYGALLADDEDYGEKARTFSSKVRDIMEFLSEVDLPPLHPVPHTVTYHEACHLVHTQKISAQPRKLIQSIPGVDFVELPEATWCCGSAGIYNIVRFEDSMKMLERKMENLAGTGAEVVLTGNPGCHMQLQYGIRKFTTLSKRESPGLNMEVAHPVTLLQRALRETSA